METTARTSRPMIALALLLGAALIVSVGFAERADSKRFSKKVIKSVSKKRLAGAYRGVTEEGTPVSFRLARSGKVIDFVVPITLGCTRENGDFDGNGAINESEPGEVTEFTKSITLRSAPLPGRKREAHYPLGMTFEYETPLIPDDQPPLGTEVLEYSIKAKFKEELFSGPGANIYWPIPKRAAAMHGELFAGSRNGPLTMQQPGRTLCSLSVNGRTSTHVIALDFDAKKTGN
jgi:hypothetical protein